MEQTLQETASSSRSEPVNRWRRWLPIGCSLSMQWGWAIWWGGLTFYAAIVVPLGTEQFGSFGQGLVTQQVTRYLNALAIIVAVMAIAEGCLEKRPIMCAAGILLGGVTAALMYQHTLLVPRIDTAVESVADDFYDAHATYLWLTTLQWCIGLFLGIRRGFGSLY
ncbi:hypothetical protein SH501x_003863 [Pirellulaceae bacterium SH501]